MLEATVVIRVQKQRTASRCVVITVYGTELYELLQKMKEVCLIHFKCSTLIQRMGLPILTESSQSSSISVTVRT